MTLLRPEWLWLLAVTVPLAWLCLRSERARSGWQNWLSPTFAAALRLDTAPSASSRSQRMLQRGLWPLLAVLLPLAVAGPSFSTDEVPLSSRQDALVIVLDLSLSMLATDIQPDRLTRARQKMLDLLDRRQEGRTALIAYAGSAHVVVPLTRDHATLRAMLPALDPLIMPEFGSRLPAALAIAEKLLNEGGSQNGRILLVTDGVDPVDAEELDRIQDERKWPLSVLAVGTIGGGPIPVPGSGFLQHAGKPVVAGLVREPIEALVRNKVDRFSSIRLDDQDLDVLLPAIRRTEGGLLDADSTPAAQTRPADQGYWVLALLLGLIVAKMWQNGTGIRALLSLLICFLPWVEPASAEGRTGNALQGLWKNADLQAAELFEQGRYDEAAALFETPAWKASALYRAGRYEEAAAAYAQSSDVNAHYNRGNALARSGALDAALAAYDQALAQKPEHEAAQKNREIILEALRQQSEASAPDQGDSDESSPREGEQDGRQGDAPGEQDGSTAAEGGAEGGAEDSAAGAQGDSANGDHSAQGRESDQRGAPAGLDGQAAPADTPESLPEETDSRDSLSPETADADAAADSTANRESDVGARGSEPAAEHTEDQDGKASSADVAAEPDDLGEQRREQWLRRIPDDPGALLRRKFEYQHRNADPRPEDPERSLW